MLDILKNVIAVTLQTTISDLGFLPDASGDKVKKILASTNGLAIMALGCILDACRADGNYDKLAAGLAGIPDEEL